MCRRKSRRPDKPMYVPRALRSQNVVSTDSNKTAGIVDRTVSSASKTVNVAAELPRVVNDLLSETISEPPSAACDAKLSSITPDYSQQSTLSHRDKKTGYQIGKKQKTTNYHDTGKKVCKSEEKSESVLLTESHRNVISDKSANVGKSNQSDDGVNCINLFTVNKTADDAAVASDHVQVADLLIKSESKCDADDSRQISAELLCTVGEPTDNRTVSLDQTVANCTTDCTITSNDTDNNVLSFSDAEECRNSPQLVSSVAVVDSELTRLSLRETDIAVEQQQPQQHHDVCPAVCQCPVSNIDKQPEVNATLDIRVNDMAEVETAALNSSDYCMGNSDDGEAMVGDDNVANSDDSDDSDSWEKMFDDSGTMLHHSDDTEEVKSCYRQTLIN